MKNTILVVGFVLFINSVSAQLNHKSQLTCADVEEITITVGEDQTLCAATETIISVESTVPGKWQTTKEGVIIETPESKTTRVSNIPYRSNTALKWVPTLTDCQEMGVSKDVMQIFAYENTPIINEITVEETECNETKLISNVDLNGAARVYYSWSTEDGKITSNRYGKELTVSEAGTYLLRVSTASAVIYDKCVVEKSFELTKMKSEIDIVIDTPLMLTCSRKTVTIDGSKSSVGSNFSYEWTTEDGEIVTEPNLTSIDVVKPGTYTLTISNSETACSLAKNITVEEHIVAAPKGYNYPYVDGLKRLKDLTIDGTQLKWYGDSEKNRSISDETVIELGGVYYATQTIDGCESVMALKVMGSEKIFVEDFGTGYDSFNISPATTTYEGLDNPSHCPPEKPQDGRYVVTSNSGLPIEGSKCTTREQGDLFFEGWYQNVKDHSFDDVNGRFLIINGDDQPREFYRRTISGLVEGEDYVFSTWIANILNPVTGCYPAIPVNVKMEIHDGSTEIASISTGDIGAETNIEDIWKEYVLNFKAISSDIVIVLKNNAP
ncbi:MAG: PKD domain-containing protein [Flavobacteriales bacterium]|nr:PKD domain-containing protein [Flavobacteriales bacterium]